VAIYSMTATRVEVAGTNFSDHGVSADLQIDVNTLDSTNFASSGWTEMIAGIKSATVNLTFNDDFAAANVDATIWSNLGANVAIKLRPTSGGITATNPEFQFTAIVSQHRFGGGVGELAQKQISWPVTGPVTRATS
jgi:hypothetical protein